MTTRLTGPLSLAGAEAYVAATCFKTGPPARVGVELEMLVVDAVHPERPVGPARVRSALADLGPLAHGGLLSTEPGGQLELSSQPADSLAACLTAAGDELTQISRATRAAGLRLVGSGVDP